MNDPIAVLSGLPESGVPLLRAKLEAIGLRLTLRTAADWCERGGCSDIHRQNEINIVPWQHLETLPASGGSFRIVFLRRNLCEVVVARLARLAQRGIDPLPGADQLLIRYQRYFQALCGDLQSRPNVRLLHVSHAELVSNPDEIARQACAFLKGVRYGQPLELALRRTFVSESA